MQEMFNPSAPEGAGGEWVLVPRDAIERAIETLENDGDEHGEGRNLRAMLDATQQPAATLPDVDDDDLTVAYMAGRHDGRKEAQQPAAVDEATVERAFDAWCGVADVDEWRVRNAHEALRAALTAALAMQGGDT